MIDLELVRLVVAVAEGSAAFHFARSFAAEPEPAYWAVVGRERLGLFHSAVWLAVESAVEYQIEVRSQSEVLWEVAEAVEGVAAGQLQKLLVIQKIATMH